jgi:branched-chain amino acid transport system ATP-binding protein
MAGLGVGRTFQNVSLFPKLSVRENILTGAHSRLRAGYWSSALRLPSARMEEAKADIEADRILEALHLSEMSRMPVASLPFGIKKKIELGRALMMNPRLLLLDEPAAGLNYEEVSALKSTIKSLRDEFQLTVVLVEHHMDLVMSTCDHVVVLNFGRKICDGAPSEVQQSEAVIAAYLG